MEIITLNNFKDLDLEELNNSKPESITDILLRREVKESLKDNGITRFKEIKDLNHISFGHFIIIEKMLSIESLDMDAKVKLVSPIILRPLEELKLDNEDREKEEAHKQMVYNEPIGNIYGAFNRFMELRAIYLYKTYNGVIYGTVHEDDEEDEEGTNIGSTQSARQFHSKKFFWNSMISLVANGDIFRFNDAVDLMMYTVMPFLAEKRSLEIIENLEAKQRNI